MSRDGHNCRYREELASALTRAEKANERAKWADEKLSAWLEGRDSTIDALRAEVAALKESNLRFSEGLYSAQMQAARLSAERDELREVLAPFALFASAVSGTRPQDDVVTYRQQGLRANAFYAAQAALAGNASSGGKP